MDACFSEDYLVSGSDYADIMNTVVLPWLEAKQQVQMLSGYQGRPLYCVSFDADQPVGTVFIVHGFTENAFKYAELIWSLLHLRYSVVIYDQRGHGRSWRPEGLPDISVTHVDHFSDYVEDLRIVCEAYASRMSGPRFLFAHSMGGAVAALYLEQHPAFFSGAVFSSPMIAPNVGGIPVGMAATVASLACRFGRGKQNPFFLKPYAGPEDFETSCATDPARFAWYESVREKYPEFRNSVPSYRWSLEAIHVTEKILAPGEPEKITCPVLLFSAGIDGSVLPEPQALFVSRIVDGTQIHVPDAKHEIFRSVNNVLFPWWHRVIGFYAGISSRRAAVKE